MPQFDRSTCSIPKSQIGFYDFFIHDMFEAWNGERLQRPSYPPYQPIPHQFLMSVTINPEYANCPELIENIGENYQYWKRQLAEEERWNHQLCRFCNKCPLPIEMRIGRWWRGCYILEPMSTHAWLFPDLKLIRTSKETRMCQIRILRTQRRGRRLPKKSPKKPHSRASSVSSWILKSGCCLDMKRPTRERKKITKELPGLTQCHIASCKLPQLACHWSSGHKIGWRWCSTYREPPHKWPPGLPELL